MNRKPLLFVLASLALTLAIPFLIPKKGNQAIRAANVSTMTMESLVVVTPHVESIRREFSIGFAEYMAREHSRRVEIQWRTPGGTSEIDRYLDTEFRAAFEVWWKANKGSSTWSSDMAEAVGVRKAPAEWQKHQPHKVNAREEFLKSSTSIKMDLLFGGGVYDFEKQKDKGYLVATAGDGKHGLKAVQGANPDWFSEEIMPLQFSGDKFRDPDLAWAGSCLSSFGILYNTDVLTRKGIATPPARWVDLAEPGYIGAVALADPSKSASAGKAFEMILQQEIQASLKNIKPPTEDMLAPGTVRPPANETEAVHQGWLKGLEIIQRIGANARYFTDAGPKPPSDVSRGEAAAGMCIDFYGRTYVEKLSRMATKQRLQYISPIGGTAVSVDPIAMFRGAPNPELATRFLTYVLGKEGQRLWANRVGTPGGPVRTALRRQPVRKDLYSAAELANASDPHELPYQNNTFVYKAEYTSEMFQALRFIIRAMCIESHEELRDAWVALQAHGFPKQAMTAFQNMDMVGYEKVLKGMVPILGGSDKVQQARLARDLANQFRGNYVRARDLAEGRL